MAIDATYLDYNATAPVRPVAAEAMVHALQVVGNPSSVHGFGRAARRIVEDARENVAALVGASPTGVIFTSGGTEANALALAGWPFRRRIIVSAVEHPSVVKSPGAETVPVDGQGVVDLAALERLLEQSDGPVLVAVMLANNETGVVQPITEIVRLAQAHGALVHCDAVQAAGKMPVDLMSLGVDSLSLSAHKLGGPQGVGALVLRDAEAELTPLAPGGGQERRRRSGTENVPGIAGFAAAAVAAGSDLIAEASRLAGLRDELECRVMALAPDAVVFGQDADRLPNTSCLAVPGVSAQTAVMGFDLAGVAISAGSACSSGKVAPSHVLAAMGAGALAGSAIRVSLGWASQVEDIEKFISVFARVTARKSADAA